MELKEVLRVFGRAGRLFFVSSTLLAGAGFFIFTYLPTNYRVTLDLYVKRQTQAPSDQFYSFDGFYSQQAAERYTQTVVGFLKSREILKEALSAIQRPYDQEVLKKLERSVKVKEAAPQLVVLTVGGTEAAFVKSLSLALAGVATEKLRTLNKTGDAALSIDLLTTAPFLEVETPSPWLGGFIGALLGLFLALFFVSLREYLLHDGSGH